MMNIRLRKGKSLHAYLSRFNMATLEVYNLDQFMAMTILKRGLPKNTFLFSLKKTYL